MRRLVTPLLLAALAWGCDQEQPIESANMRRPAGLAAVDRGTTDDGLTRSDVLIVDSEAQGVRVLQYARDDTGLGKRFVPGPVVFFPLIISAPGYPTRIAVNADGDTAFVIGTVDVGIDLDTVREGRSYIHVLDVPELSTSGRITPDDHILVNSLDITDVVPGEAFIPVDITAITSTTATVTPVVSDRFAVAFDAVGSSSGRVAIYDFDFEIRPGSADLDLAPTNVYEVPGGVEAITVRNGLVYTTSALPDATSATAHVVTEVHPNHGVIGALDAGGPTNGLVDAGPFGLLALRADRPSVVVFEGDPLVRSTRVYPSPYTPVEERGRGGDVLGRIDLRNSPLGPAAFAPNVPQLTIAGTSSGRDAPVVMVTHANGFASFLFATGDDPASPETFGLGVVSEPEPTGVYLAQPPASIRGCTVEVTLEVGDTNVDCDRQIVQVPTTGAARYRARFRGELARSRSGRWTPVDDAGYGILTDDRGVRFADRLVRAGDSVRIVAPDLEDCSATGAETTYLGTVTVAREDSVEVQIDTPALGAVCDEVDSFELLFYEVFPSGDEGVLAQVNAGTIVEVLERAPSVVTSSLARTVFGTTPRPDGSLPPMAFELVTGPACGVSPTPGDICSSLLECPEGWGCVARSLNPTPDEELMPVEEPEPGAHVPSPVAGLSRCERSVCPQGVPVCLEAPYNRGCPGLEITVLGTLTAEADLKQDSGRLSSSVPSSAPDDAVSFDAGRHFMVSYPGSRSVVEVRTGSSLVFDQIR